MLWMELKMDVGREFFRLIVPGCTWSMTRCCTVIARWPASLISRLGIQVSGISGSIKAV